MASKIFCCCCYPCEGSSTTVGSHNKTTCQEHHTRTLSLNTDPHKDNTQKRHPHHHPNMLAMKVCQLGRP
uniref:Uncharacterized protein n=1 Tax=Catagonus wagneri TaxID=51154 RepID=A0A8C3WXY0_9CETA